MIWDIELRRFDDGALYATGVTPRGVAWLEDNIAEVDEDNSVRLDPSDDYEYAARQILAAGLTVVDVTPSQGERASAAASQAARSIKSY